MADTAHTSEKHPGSHQTTRHLQGVVVGPSPVLAAGSTMLQRKATCACGGGCPACRAAGTNLAISPSSDRTEAEAESAADRVMQAEPSNPESRIQINRQTVEGQRSAPISMSKQPDSSGRDEDSLAPQSVRDTLGAAGKPLDQDSRAFMESRFQHDFGRVRIHDDAQAAASARSINALAYTSGERIAFAAGQYDAHSESGKRLLAHELDHVVQQKGIGSKIIQRTVDDAQVEKEFNDWADANKRVKDRTSQDFPWAVWDFVRPKIVDSNTMDPLPKPKDAKKAAEWQDNFDRAEIIARWLFNIKSTTKDDTLKGDADTKAHFILTALAQAGFVSKAIAQSGYLSPDNRKSLYGTILKNPDSASASELETIVKFQCNGVANPADVPIIQTFTDGNASPLKKLPADKTQAIIGVLATKYGTHDVLVNAIAEVLMFNPAIRNSVSDAMMNSTIGSPQLLFKVLKHKFFVEPGYDGGELLKTLVPSGTTNATYDAQRMTNDMPWVYTYKQKYYVDYLVDLAKSQNITIPKPTALTFAGLKPWLDANTEKIGEAAKAKYPPDPNAVFEIYRNIADIFFYHIPHDRDVAPNLEGKISHLQEGAPARKRFEADCDVFATYAMRLFFNAGFEPIGYMAYVPAGSFKDRAAHVSALLRKDGKYSIINNKGILDAGVSEAKTDEKKEEALKAMRNKAMRDAYADPVPTDLKLYYEDAEAKGKMSQKFRNQDSSLERADLL